MRGSRETSCNSLANNKLLKMKTFFRLAILLPSLVLPDGRVDGQKVNGKWVVQKDFQNLKRVSFKQGAVFVAQMT